MFLISKLNFCVKSKLQELVTLMSQKFTFSFCINCSAMPMILLFLVPRIVLTLLGGVLNLKAGFLNRIITTVSNFNNALIDNLTG